MTPRQALMAFAALTSCSAEHGQKRDGKVVVVGGRIEASGPTSGTKQPSVDDPTIAAAPPDPAAPTPTLEVPTPVHGEFTDKPLPAELAHLRGLGGRSTSAEESAQ